MPINSQWHYAVVVGIDQYPGFKKKKDLNFPQNDATAMEAWLRNPLGGNIPLPAAPDQDRIQKITRTAPPPSPVESQIKDAILNQAEAFHEAVEKLASPQARQDAWRQSRFYLYISGHGIDGSGSDVGLVTASARRGALDNVSILSALNHLKVNRVFAEIVIIADCCREFNRGLVQDLPWSLEDLNRFDYPPYPAVFIALASRERKQAFEPQPNNPQGITLSFFTYTLLQGLNGAASQGGTQVTSTTLAAYLRQEVPSLTELAIKVKQHPDITESYPPIIFATDVQPVTAHLNVPANSALQGTPTLEALVIDGSHILKRTAFELLHDGTFQATLAPGNYLAVPAGADPVKNAVPNLPFHFTGVTVHV